MDSNNPLAGLLGNTLPQLRGFMQGDNPMSRPLRELSPNDVTEDSSFVFRILMDLSLQDFLAIMSGNDSVIWGMRVSAEAILLERYMNGNDTAPAREEAAWAIAKEICDKLKIPQELTAKVKPGTDPMSVIR